MSVLARKRKLSKYEFYANAIKLRKAMTFLLLRDLGVKNKVRNLRITTQGMEENDAEKFVEIASKYGMAGFIAEYPEWMIDKLRNSLWELMRDMIVNITRAYTIWATNVSEAYERRNYQDRAIADCESLLKEMELAVDVLPVDANKYINYVGMIEREISLLKGWRKSDNKRIHEFEHKIGVLTNTVASSSNFCNSDNNGNANNNNASNTGGGVRPLLEGTQSYMQVRHSRE